MPPSPPPAKADALQDPNDKFLQPYPTNLTRRLKATLFPLDITNKHVLTRGAYRAYVAPLLEAGSPLATWTSAWLESTFNKMESLQDEVSGDAVGLQLHDPLTVYYCMTQSNPKWKLAVDEDIRVETSGQWTRGLCVVDRRSRRKMENELLEEVPGDHGNWLAGAAGNRLRRCVGTPGDEAFGKYLLETVFGL